MGKESSTNPTPLSRMASFIKTVDRKIDDWVHYFINQIDNERNNQHSRDD